MNNYPVIIDVDTGLDDAVELILAHLNPQIDIQAITCVGGNIDLENVCLNTNSVLHYIGDHTPIYAGCAHPLHRELRFDYFFGKRGFGNVQIPWIPYEEKEIDAIEFMYQTAMQHDKVDFLCTGPLTNMEMLLTKHPDVKEHIHKLVFMGGSLSGGNVTIASEFNAYADPEAAQFVLHSCLDCTMIGLDVTSSVYISKEMKQEIEKMESNQGKLTNQILNFYQLKKEKETDPTLVHDVIALCAYIHPEFFMFKDYYMEVETEGKYTTGATLADYRNVCKKEPNCRVAIQLDGDAFCDWFMRSLRGENL